VVLQFPPDARPADAPSRAASRLTGAAAAGPSGRRVALLGFGVAALAAGVRIWTLAELEAADPLALVPILDEAVYLREARRLGEGLGPTTPSLVALLWPWTLAALGAVTQHAAALVDVAIGSLVAALAAAGAARLAGSLAAGVVAGAVCALSGALVFQDATAQIEPLLGLLALSTALALAAAARAPTWTRLTVAGLLAGVAILGRGTNAALLVGVLPALRGAAAGARASRVAVFVAAAAVPILVFDAAVGAVPSSPGVNVWLGNNGWSRDTLSFGTDEIAMDPDGEARDIVAVAEAAERRKLSTAEVNAWWLGRAAREVAAEPGAAAAHLARKTALLFYAPDMGGNRDVDAEREFATWLRVAPVSAAWILVLGAAGWVVARRTSCGLGAFALATSGGLATLVVVFPLTRYRMPFVPAAAVLAGVGVAAVIARRVDRRRLVAGAATVVVLGAMVVVAGAIRPARRPEAWTNLGQAAIDTGVGDADAFLRRAVADDPTYPWPSLLLGERALARGDAAEALRRFDAAIAAAGASPRWAGAARRAAEGRARALHR
jgi:hypothetical protein